MKINQPRFAAMTLCGVIGMAGHATAWEPGIYPNGSGRMASTGFSVNNQDRNDVVSFWHAVYQASEGYENRVDWKGNYSGKNGSTSSDFVDDVERRLNYFRAMSGVRSDVEVSSRSTVTIDPTDEHKPSAGTLRSEAAQDAALMLVRNYNPQTGADPALTHNPPSDLVGWSPAAWNANAKGNFAFGVYGPGAITEYMIEQLSYSTATSSWNSLVGHRRWNLFPNATKFATGDQPGASSSLPPTNVFYVLQKPSEMLEEASGFVAYPAAGFFPAEINSPYWSLSREGADFAFASVKMTDASGNSVPIVNTKKSNDYGDPAIIWQVGAAANIRSVARDTTFNIQITGIGGRGIPTSFAYSVTLINPNLLTTNQQIAGASSVRPSASSSYTFSAPAGAEGVLVEAARKSSTRWTENAENPGKSNVTDGTTGNYPLVAKISSILGFSGVTGSRSFNLTFPSSYDLITRGVPDQSFEINRDLIANSNAKLKFQFRRGYMTRSSTLAVETSSDGGATWKVLGDSIKGVNDNQIDIALTSVTRSLPMSADPIRVRFRYFTRGGSIYTHEATPKAPTGIFIDEIKTTGCDWLEQKKVNVLPVATTQFTLQSSTIGTSLKKGDEWRLRMRTKFGGKWFQHGPSKKVTVTGS